MATYKELHGEAVRDVSSDPTNSGEIFYNSSTDTFRSVVQSSAWVSASALSTSRRELNGAGTADSSLAMGGYTTTTLATTEEFNGSGWSNAEDMPAVKHAAASGGLQTAAFIAGGYPDPAGNTATYEYDGTNWGSGGSLSQARRGFTGSGTLTAGLAMGGFSDPVSSGAPLTNVEEYDGTNWTSGGALPAGNANIGAAGTQTATVAFGGYLGPSGNTTNAYHYDGSSWTSTGSMNTARSSLGGSGIQTSAMGFGGAAPSASAATELYNGSTWTTSTNMATARYNFGSAQNAPSNTTGLAFGGGPPHTAVTEDWNVSTTVTTPAAFSSGGTMGTGRYGGQYFGTGKASQVACGGHVPGSPPSTANSETYDGTTWSEGNNINTARFNGAGGGTETAGVISMGRSPSDSNATEEYNGSSWTTVTASPETKYRKVGAGTQTALIVTGGLNSPPTVVYPTTSLEYDGTNWTSGGTAPFGGNYMDGVGTETSAVVFGGNSPNDPAGQSNNLSFDYNGSAWTANNNINSNHAGQHFASGTVTDAIIGAGGAPYTIAAVSETYDGTTFATNATLATEGQRGGKGTTSGAAFAVGGHPPYLAVTEEYTAASTAVNVKTITTS